LFEIDHCSAGQWLSKSWNLPADMTEAIASHHEPGLAQGSLASLIAVSDSLAAALGYGTVELKSVPRLPDVIAQLGVDDADAALKKVEALTGGIAEVLAVVSSRR
jgi:HD-like signal output (HDOD) protein